MRSLALALLLVTTPAAAQVRLSAPIVSTPPPSDLAASLARLDAALAAAKQAAGVPSVAEVIDPGFWRSRAGIAVTVIMAIVGAGITAVEAWASIDAVAK